MSDTPRTDERAVTHPWVNGEAKYVAVEFARELERENAALKAGTHLMFSQRLLPKVIAQRDRLEKLLKLLSESDQHPTVTVAEVAQYAKQGLAAIGKEAQP